MGIQKDVLVWSAADLSTTPTVGSTFTVTGAPDLMAFKDDEAGQFPADFDPAVTDTIEPNQTLSGSLDGVEFTGNNASTDVFEFELAFQVTDGTNTFNIYQIDNDVFGGSTTAYVSEVALDPNATYTVLAQDDGVNFENGTGYETTPVWDDLAGQVDGTSGDDVIGTGFVDDDDDRVDGNDGENDFIVGEGGGDTISSGAGDDVIYGDHADDLPAGTTEYIAQGFFRDVNFELESGTFNFTDSVVSISDDPLEIRFVDNDGVLDGDTTSSETPDDTDQLVEINGVLYNYSADYLIQMSGSNGQTYDMLVLDVDRDDSGLIDANDPTSDPGDNDYENGQILIPRGDVPPPGVTLTAFGPTYDLVNEDYSNLNGAAVVTNYDDTIDAGAGDDTVFGGQGDDTITGGEGADTLTGGAGADSFIVDDGGDIITDFDTGGGVENGDPTDNDFVDLSAYYNQTTLDAWNLANPGNQYGNPLAWMQADQQDGTLDQVGGLQLQNGGSAVAASELNAENTGVVCFTKGTLIATARGEVPVETLQVGDLVQTMDHGLQPIRWIGARHLKQTDLAEKPKLRPIRISSTVMGLPDHEQDLVVSPQHRILVSSKIAQRMLGDGEVLIAANKLLGLEGVEVASDKSAVTYYHVLCDAHEILFANGIPAESLYLGNEALKSLTPEGLAEIRALFPELVGKDVTPRFCRTVVSGSRAKNLCRRHAKNHKPLIEYGASMRSGIAPDSAFGTAAAGLGAKGITPGATPVAYAAE